MGVSPADTVPLRADLASVRLLYTEVGGHADARYGPSKRIHTR